MTDFFTRIDRVGEALFGEPKSIGGFFLQTFLIIPVAYMITWLLVAGMPIFVLYSLILWAYS